MDEIGRRWEDFRRRDAAAKAHGEPPRLFNAESIDGAAELVWCNSEAEVEALEDAGCASAVAVIGRLVERHRAHSDPIAAHADALEKVSKHVLACADPELREELARRLGRHRCWLVTWPEGRANVAEVIRRDGVDAVKASLQTAAAYPIEGLHRITAGTLLSLRGRPAPATMGTGARSTDAILKLPTEGRCIIVTGYPSSGKTAWMRFIAVSTSTDHGRRWAVFSPESQPWEHFAAECAEVFIGKPFYRQGCLADHGRRRDRRRGGMVGQPHHHDRQ
jgi:twinkle protein